MPTKDRATCFSKENTVLKMKAAASQKSNSETEQFTKIMWAAVSLQHMRVITVINGLTNNAKLTRVLDSKLE